MTDNHPPTQRHNDYNGTGHDDRPTRKRHSKTGIASFILGIAAIVGLILIMIYSTIAMGDLVLEGGGVPDEATIAELTPAFILITLGVLGVLGANVIGVILGIVATVKKDFKRQFGIIGLVLNGLCLLGFLTLMMIGVMMQM